MTSEKPPVEEAKDRTNDIAWQIRLFRSGIPPEGNVDSHLTLESHLVDPSFYALESPFDVLDQKLADEEKIRKLINYIRDKSNIRFAQR